MLDYFLFTNAQFFAQHPLFFQVIDKPNALPLEVQTGNIVFDNVQFGYTPSRKVLDGVSFDVRKGETVALVSSF